ncbi:cytosine permease [Castellaniella sp.]|uniref:purine-cytosine permease family protein n=1 Tax=Castellaniella sp. TaxID=1955812 RepID=UPI0035641B92
MSRTFEFNENLEVINQVGRVENVGVEYIPPHQRTAKLSSMFWILFGGSETFGIMVIGWVAVSLGLGWWDSLTAIVVGTAVGSTLMSPVALFGPRTGTNAPVSSGAHFGALGRLIGSFLGVSASLVFAALCVWAAGDALAGAVMRLATGSADNIPFWLQATGYLIVSAVMLIVSVMGHANMVAFCKWMVPTAGVIMLVAVWLFWSDFDSSYAGGDYALGGRLPTWILAAITCAGTTNSYAPYTGDWTRHLSTKYTKTQIIAVAWFGSFVGMGHAYLWGAFIGTLFADPTTSLATGLVQISPTWFLIPVLYIALVPGTAQAVINLYSMGLDFASIVPGLTRVAATILLGGISVILVFIGGVYSQVANLVASFIAILIIMGAPWSVICIIGFINRKGFYFYRDLQVFNLREVGGRYWFDGGIEPRACLSWIIGVVVGVFFINTGWYVSPGATYFDGADFAFAFSAGASAISYIVLLIVLPEPVYLFGEQGSVFGMNRNKVEYRPIEKSTKFSIFS